jgi:ubiquinone/menaquinone biosynthesis C-methylase UbiE
LPEFTGERVVPGQVEPDLWNEHYARYVFAARLARGKRILDVGCGAGYGSAELARAAQSVTSVDLSPAALESAASAYPDARIRWLAASADALPFPGASFDLITIFEVIEHLDNWPAVLDEARRLLAPGGQLVISTPNRLYYAEARKQHGPNPYHRYEFEYAEFRAELEKRFPSVAFFLQNHVQAIAFQPTPSGSAAANLQVDRAALKPEESHFFLAVCALAPQTGAPLFVYLPSTANLLRERELHIDLLESELAQKDAWLEGLKKEHSELQAFHQEQERELQRRTEWIDAVKAELAKAHADIKGLQQYQGELESLIETERRAAAEAIAGYEGKLSELEADLAERTRVFRQNEERLESELRAKSAELARCVELLHTAETTVEERTRWAQELDARIAELQALLDAVQSSRWIRLGRTFGVGPLFGKS